MLWLRLIQQGVLDLLSGEEARQCVGLPHEQYHLTIEIHEEGAHEPTGDAEDKKSREPFWISHTPQPKPGQHP